MRRFQASSLSFLEVIPVDSVDSDPLRLLWKWDIFLSDTGDVFKCEVLTLLHKAVCSAHTFFDFPQTLRLK